jgi:hypothetical protein
MHTPDSQLPPIPCSHAHAGLSHSRHSSQAQSRRIIPWSEQRLKTPQRHRERMKTAWMREEEGGGKRRWTGRKRRETKKCDSWITGGKSGVGTPTLTAPPTANADAHTQYCSTKRSTWLGQRKGGRTSSSRSVRDNFSCSSTASPIVVFWTLAQRAATQTRHEKEGKTRKKRYHGKRSWRVMGACGSGKVGTRGSGWGEVDGGSGWGGGGVTQGDRIQKPCLNFE